MVDGLAPNVAYLPVAALAALTAALVTLVIAVSAWKKANGESLDTEQSDCKKAEDERPVDDQEQVNVHNGDVPSGRKNSSESDSSSVAEELSFHTVQRQLLLDSKLATLRLRYRGTVDNERMCSAEIQFSSEKELLNHTTFSQEDSHLASACSVPTLQALARSCADDFFRKETTGTVDLTASYNLEPSNLDKRSTEEFETAAPGDSKVTTATVNTCLDHSQEEDHNSHDNRDSNETNCSPQSHASTLVVRESESEVPPKKTRQDLTVFAHLPSSLSSANGRENSDPMTKSESGTTAVNRGDGARAVKRGEAVNGHEATVAEFERKSLSSADALHSSADEYDVENADSSRVVDTVYSLDKCPLGFEQPGQFCGASEDTRASTEHKLAENGNRTVEFAIANGDEMGIGKEGGFEKSFLVSGEASSRNFHQIESYNASDISFTPSPSENLVQTRETSLEKDEPETPSRFEVGEREKENSITSESLPSNLSAKVSDPERDEASENLTSQAGLAQSCSAPRAVELELARSGKQLLLSPIDYSASVLTDIDSAGGTEIAGSQERVFAGPNVVPDKLDASSKSSMANSGERLDEKDSGFEDQESSSQAVVREASEIVFFQYACQDHSSRARVSIGDGGFPIPKCVPIIDVSRGIDIKACGADDSERTAIRDSDSGNKKPADEADDNEEHRDILESEVGSSVLRETRKQNENQNCNAGDARTQHELYVVVNGSPEVSSPVYEPPLALRYSHTVYEVNEHQKDCATVDSTDAQSSLQLDSGDLEELAVLQESHRNSAVTSKSNTDSLESAPRQEPELDRNDGCTPVDFTGNANRGSERSLEAPGAVGHGTAHGPSTPQPPRGNSSFTVDANEEKNSWVVAQPCDMSRTVVFNPGVGVEELEMQAEFRMHDNQSLKELEKLSERDQTENAKLEAVLGAARSPVQTAVETRMDCDARLPTTVAIQKENLGQVSGFAKGLGEPRGTVTGFALGENGQVVDGKMPLGFSSGKEELQEYAENSIPNGVECDRSPPLLNGSSSGASSTISKAHKLDGACSAEELCYEFGLGDEDEIRARLRLAEARENCDSEQAQSVSEPCENKPALSVNTGKSTTSTPVPAEGVVAEFLTEVEEKRGRSGGGDAESVLESETHEKTRRRALSEQNNGNRDGFVRLPSPGDVTPAEEESAATAARQDGKARAVQGSRRDHLTRKAYLEGSYAVTPRTQQQQRGTGRPDDDEYDDCSVFASPAQRYAGGSPAQLQMADSGDGRCDPHDRSNREEEEKEEEAAPLAGNADGLKRLDALVELLNDLASPEDASAASTSTGDAASSRGPFGQQIYGESDRYDYRPDGTFPRDCSPVEYVVQRYTCYDCERREGQSTSFWPKNEDSSYRDESSFSVNVSSYERDGLPVSATHSSYNADVSSNPISDESTTCGYPELSVVSSTELCNITSSVVSDTELSDFSTVDVCDITKSSNPEVRCDTPTERTDGYSLEWSQSSAVSPTDSYSLTNDLAGALSFASPNEESKEFSASDVSAECEETLQLSSPLEPAGGRGLVLQNLRALTSRLKTPSCVWRESPVPGAVADLGRSSPSIGVSAGSENESLFEESTPSTAEYPATFSDDPDMSESDSPRRQRLLKLLERDRERQARLQKLSSENKKPAGENEDPKNALQALENAIGHMQELVGRNEEALRPLRDLHQNELHFSTVEERRTIDTGRRAEVQHHDPISRDPLENGNHANRHNDDTQEHVRAAGEHFQGHLTVADSQELQAASERYFSSTKISIGDTEIRDNAEIIYDPGTTAPQTAAACGNRHEIYVEEGAPRRLGDVTGIANDRWRRESGEVDHKWIGNAGNQSGEKRRAWKATEDYRSEAQLGGAERSAASNKKSKSENAAQWRWETRGASDVRRGFTQSPAASRGEEQRASECQSFSHDLARSTPTAMESGGCETEDHPPSNGNDTAATTTTSTTPTPTKIKNLRFKLDPDIYDLPSENGYEYDEYNRRPNWRKQTKYNTFSALELGRSKEPVKVVSVRTSVVPGGQKMVVKPVCVSEGQRTGDGRTDDSRITVKHLDIDLRIRLETEERDNSNNDVVQEVKREINSTTDVQVKRGYLNNVSQPPAQAKRRSPVPEFSSWNQSLSPVSETCDFMPSSAESTEAAQSGFDSGESNLRWSPESSYRGPDGSRNDTAESTDGDSLALSNGDFGKGDEPRTEQNATPFKDSESQQAFKRDSRDKTGPLTSTPSRPSSLALNQFRKHLQMPRKKFVPDPEAIERITGYRAAEERSGSKPPLPPVIRSLSSNRIGSNSKSRIEQLRKRYLDSKSLIAAHRVDSGSKFEQFLNRAQEDRAKIVTSTPDLAAFEAAVRSQWSKARKQSDPTSGKENTPPPDPPPEIPSADSGRSSTPDDVWLRYVQSLRRQLNRRSQSLSYLETDIDAFLAEDKSRSMTTLEKSARDSTQSLATPSNYKEHRISLCLDESGRTKSEHELRIEKSLQNLTVPDWYRHSQRAKPGFLLDKKTDEKKGWAAVKSLTSSTSSLSSAGTKPKRPARSLRNSRENLLWSRGSSSPASADNSYTRWGRTHSGPVLSLAVAKAFREPYLGWRTRTPSSCTSPSPQPDMSPPSWVVMDNTERSDTPLTSDLQAMDEEDTGFSFDGEDARETVNTSSRLLEGVVNGGSPPPHSADDTCEDLVNISMETCEVQPLVNGHGEDSKIQDVQNDDTCDDIKNITMDTFELGPPVPNEEPKVSPLGDDTSDDVLNISTDTSSHLNQSHDVNQNGQKEPASILATEDTGNGIDNISTDISEGYRSQPLVNGTTRSGSASPMQEDCSDPRIVKSEPKLRETKEGKERSKFDPKRKRYSYNRSIYQNELDGLKGKNQGDQGPEGLEDGGSTRSLPADSNESKGNNVIWIESSFVGSRTTTSIMVMPTEPKHKSSNGCCRGNSTGSSNSSVGRPASR